MKRTAVILIAVVGAFAVWTACTGDDPDSVANSERGAENQRCFENGSCFAGLTCVSDLCRVAGGTSGTSGSSSGATSSSSSGNATSSSSSSSSGDAGGGGLGCTPTPGRGPSCLGGDCDAGASCCANGNGTSSCKVDPCATSGWQCETDLQCGNGKFCCIGGVVDGPPSLPCNAKPLVTAFSECKSDPKECNSATALRACNTGSTCDGDCSPRLAQTVSAGDVIVSVCIPR